MFLLLLLLLLFLLLLFLLLLLLLLLSTCNITSLRQNSQTNYLHVYTEIKVGLGITKRRKNIGKKI